MLFYNLPGFWTPFFIYLGIYFTSFFILSVIFVLIKSVLDKLKFCGNLSDYILISKQCFFINILELMQIDHNYAEFSQRQGFEELFNINREAIVKKFIMDWINNPERINNPESEIDSILNFVIPNFILNYKVMGFFLNNNKPSLSQKFAAVFLCLLYLPFYLYGLIFEQISKLLMYIIYILKPSKIFRIETLNVLLASLLIVVNASLGIHLSSIGIIVSVNFIRSFFICAFISLFVGFNLKESYEAYTAPAITKKDFIAKHFVDQEYCSNILEKIKNLSEEETYSPA